ncbi:glycosyltransferase [Nocardioides glacieisoli]|uniref:Glycosyltransferase n=1 Tax=Nocardioides glacieisoli TaxID=1168730 RepID=A0A4V1RLK5_9ACTN|nr:glycosyltransferase [Nocardioides glacieisoli]RYB96102.1 glycosyltransferase [Nocardioides glacieisoli]
MAEQFPFVRYRDVDPRNVAVRMASARPRVSVVITVHDGGEAVRSCIQSVLDNSPTAHRIIIIDDAGRDPVTRRIVDGFDGDGKVELIRHEICLGYTQTANHGLRLADDDDVVLLNSDTVVPPMWLQRLSWTAYSQSGVGTVSAVSNDAAANSVPFRHQRNDWYPRRQWCDSARLMSRGMRVWSQEVPSAHGFCMYIRRALIEELGFFDTDGFPIGYGEEVDYSQRAIRAGWSNLVAPHVLVKHLRSQSFGLDRRKQLVESSEVVLWQRYPRLGADVAMWESSLGAALIKQNASRIRSGWSGAELAVRKIVVRDLDDEYTHVNLTDEDESLVREDEWCFTPSSQTVDSRASRDRVVCEMVLLGCAESVVHHFVSAQSEQGLSQLTRELGVTYSSAPHADHTRESLDR